MTCEPLHQLAINETGIVKYIGANTITAPSQIRTIQRLLDLGLIENTPVTCVGISMFGTPKAYQIRGAVLALRKEDAGLVWIEKKSA